MNLGRPEDLEEEGVCGEGVGSDDVGEESAAGDIEDQCGAISADTPSCFDCGRMFSSWQGVNIHAQTCS